MANYTAKDIATLRQMTGAGMLDCRNALDEADGDIEKAAQILREKGLSGAAKRSDRRSRLDLDAEHGDGTQDKAREPPLISTAAPQLSR